MPIKSKTHPIPALLSGLIIGLLSQNASAVTYDIYNDYDDDDLGNEIPSEFTGTGEELANALISDGSGITYVANSSAFQGNFDDTEYPDDFEPSASTDYDYGSASLFYDLNMGTIDDSGTGDTFSLPNGVLLTSGYAEPPSDNTEIAYTGLASALGDAGLDALLEANGFTERTTDATVLSFNFTVESGINAVSLDFIFGTDEYPDLFSDPVPDIAAVFIDGVNYAGFSDGNLLAFTSESESNFFDNNIWDVTIDAVTGDELITDSGELAPHDTEYNGISAPLTLLGLLDATLDTHSIKIAISDTNDADVDSGLYVANLQGLTIGGTTSADPLLPEGGSAGGEAGSAGGEAGSSGGGFAFSIKVGDTGVGIDPTTPIFIDPYVATGYVYESTGANFATVQIAGNYGDDIYNLYYWNGVQYIMALSDWNGDQYNFLGLDVLGFSQFKIDGIETYAGLDPTSNTAFVTGLTFVSGGQINVTQTAIQTCDGSSDCASTNNIPEPSALFLLGAGLLGWRITGRRKK